LFIFLICPEDQQHRIWSF